MQNGSTKGAEKKDDNEKNDCTRYKSKQNRYIPKNQEKNVDKDSRF